MDAPTLRKQLLESNDYRAFLRHVVEHKNSPRGLRKRLAESAGCQAAYFSQVLAGDSHLTPEQAEKLAVFWALPELEADYFFSLVLENRAGTPSLRTYLRKKREALRQQSREEAFQEPALEAPEWATQYYSHWLYSAVHVLLSVPTLRTAKALAEHLHQSPATIEAVLKDLSNMKLAQSHEGRFTLTTASLYAGDRGAHAELHHRNWRVFAAAAQEMRGNLRYTCVHSLSRADFSRVREMLESVIRESRGLLEPSPEETGACLMIDWLEL